MPIIKDTSREASGFYALNNAPDATTPRDPGFLETGAAAFRLENPVVNAFDWMTSENNYVRDPNLKIGDYLRQYDTENGSSFWENYRDNFVDARNEQEIADIMGKINRENEDRDIMDRAGWTGTVMGIAAGTLSPTVFLPFIGQASGAAAVARGALWGAIGGLADEVPLQANQQTRTIGETALAVGAGTVIGGMLGGAAAWLKSGEYQKIEAGIATSRGDTTISSPQSAGAANVPFGAGNVARGAQMATKLLDTTALTRSPVTYNAASGDEYVSGLATMFDDVGLGYEGNTQFKPQAEGGTIWNNQAYYHSQYGEAMTGSDEAWKKYAFGPEGTRTVDPFGIRSNLAARSQKKMSKSEFLEQVFLATHRGDVHEVPEVAEAATKWRTMFTSIWKEAERVGMKLPEYDGVNGSYMSYMADTAAIARNSGDFVDMLQKNYQAQLEAQFEDSLVKLESRNARDAETAEDLVRPADEVARLREEFKAKLKEDEAKLDPEYLTKEDQIADLQERIRESKSLEEKAQLRADVKTLKEQIPDTHKEQKKGLLDVKRRLRNLNRSRSSLEARQAQKFAGIERVEEANLSALNRAARAGQKALRGLDKVADNKLDDYIEKVREQFEKMGKVWERGEDRIEELRLREDDPEMAKVLGLDELQADRLERMGKIEDKLSAAEGFDRESAREALNDAMQDVLARINDVNNKRASRLERMWKQYENLSPDQVKTKLDALKAAGEARTQKFIQNAMKRGADDVDVVGRKADFSSIAKESAFKMKDKYLGTTLRLPVVDTLGEARGPELVRGNDIPIDEMAPYLERNIEKVARAYIRTMGADIEIHRRFGTLNFGEIWQRAIDNMNVKIEKVKAAPEVKDLKKGEKRPEGAMTKEEKEKAYKKINDEYGAYKANQIVLWERARHQRGLPTDPEGFAYRAGETMLQLNTLRLMGRVTISSVADVGRPIMRYGLLRVFKDGYLPMITNFKQTRIAMKDAKKLLGMLDPYMHSRGQALSDITDDLQRGTKFEKGLNWASNRIGIVAMFDYWTNAAKQFTALVANGKLMDDLEAVATGKGNQRQIEYLAANGYSDQLVQRTWAAIQGEGGANRVNGTWWPNTANWADQDLVRTYQSALRRETDISIVTPGIGDKPAWVDKNVGFKMLAQFKSFSYASTYKTSLAGAQGLSQGDMAFAQGVMISLAFGSLSYYLYGMAAGGKAQEDMLSAGVDKWADEAINRSGILGILGEVQRIGESIPATQPYVSLSGGRSTKRAGDNLVEAIGGPSLDLINKIASVITGIDDPTQGTAKAMRSIIPFQNTIGLSKIFDFIENSLNLPEKRS